ncbi:MMPL family transporter [Nocardioides sambongensis]|uniref:MMPL family transporter n=1 Tax=Nocardioides sambongensis TaxID=2589074 RepID=UPI0018C8B30A|nr:MMPL family transporter [Nocardioides sambongensis]
MNTLHRVGAATAAHPWRTLAAWLLALIALGAASAVAGGDLQEDWNVPGTRAQAGVDTIRDHFPEAGGATAQVVLHSDGPLDPGVVGEVGDRLAAADHVAGVTPRLSDDGDTALLDVRYAVEVTHPDLMGVTAPLTAAAEPAEAAGYEVELGGELPSTASELDGRGELIGIGVALLLLVLAFGSVVAAGLPIATALGGLIAGSSGVMLLAAVLDVSPTAPTVATMVGLGVGIDYALLIVTRHVARLRAGDTPRQAAAHATGTAGRAVLGAGLTVLVSLMGLRLANLPTFSAFGFATALAVVGVMAAALTLVPALCALAGHRLLPRRVRRTRPVGTDGSGQAERSDDTEPFDDTERSDDTGREPLAGRWARVVSRRPVAWGALALVVLVALGAPALGMRTWPQDGGSDPQGSTTRAAYDLISAEFGEGANGPITLVADLDELTPAEVEALHAEVDALPQVAASSPAVTSPDGAIAIWDVQPTTAPIDEETSRFLDDLRADVLPAGVEATGYTPILGTSPTCSPTGSGSSWASSSRCRWSC